MQTKIKKIALLVVISTCLLSMLSLKTTAQSSPHQFQPPKPKSLRKAPKTKSNFRVTPNVQLASGNAFLQGDYVEVAVGPCGNFASTVNAPSGFHPNGWGRLSGLSQLGFVANPAKDDWATSVGDYFLPGQPEEGFGLSVNGANYNNNLICTQSDIPGSVIDYQSTATEKSATWQGAINGLSIAAKTYIPTGALYFVTKVTITNTTASPINNIYYMRNVDPDQGVNTVGSTGSFYTYNSVVYQNPNPSNKALVSATAYSDGGQFLGLGSIDTRAKVSTGGFSNRSAADIYNGIGLYQSATNRYADEAISISFNLGTLLPNESTTLSYAYILSFADLDAALASTNAPTIGSFTPTIAAAGATVTIKGTGFTGASAISIGGVAVTSFSIVDDNTISLVVGSGASGSIAVTTLGGTATLAGFLFNTPPTVSAIAAQKAVVETAITVPFTVGDAESSVTNLIVSASLVTNTINIAGPGSSLGTVSVAGTGANRTIIFTPAQDKIGTVTIIVTVTDEGGLTTSTAFKVTVCEPVRASGIANFVIRKTVSLIDNCSDSIYIVNRSYNGAGASYQWYINGYYTTLPSFLSSASGLIGYKTALPGTYTALVVVTENGKTYSSSQSFTLTKGIIPVPSPSFNVGTVTTNGAGLASVLLNSSTPYVQGGVINTWIVNPATNVAAFDKTATSPTLSIVQTTNAQTINASLKVTPTNGCKSYCTPVQAITIPAYSPTVANFTIGVTKSKVDVCSDSVYIINSTTGGAGNNVYTWYLGDGTTINTSSTTVIGKIYTYPNTYNIQLNVTDKAGTFATKTLTVTTIGTIGTVTAVPVVYGSYNSTTSSSVNLDGGNSKISSGSGLIYKWVVCVGGVSTIYNTSSVQLTINRTTTDQLYTAVLTVTDATGCRKSVGAKQTFTIPKLVAGARYSNSTKVVKEVETSLSVYPNPVSSNLKLKISTNTITDNVEVKIYNSMGKQVSTSHVAMGGKNELLTDISLVHVNAGMYYIKVFNANGAVVGSTTVVKN